MNPLKIFIKNISKTHRGVFAAQNIKKGEVIEICPVIAIPKKQSKLIRKTILDNYVFDWGVRNQPAMVLGFGSLYNHSYKPNAEHDEQVKQKVMVFKALRDIKKGEEITHNYNGDHDNSDELWFKVK
ncbi:MAG: SET domain-containing protein [Candidatus Doudnabacteria bacterium]|nr:SET domain-containing protein [Candidatus Doudnabacteria bacterium]